jgi:hypothetical protein
MNNDLNMYRKLGSQLIDSGKWFLQHSTPLKKVRFTRTEILNAVKDATGFTSASSNYSADEYHDTVDIDTWKILIDSDWTNQKQWIADYFDCDNFAGSFTSYMADIYLLNSAGRITVQLREPTTNTLIGYHRCALIVDSKLDCYLLETQTDELVKIVKGEFPVLGKWKYVFQSFDIN